MTTRDVQYGKAWFLNDGNIISFYNLRVTPWKEECDQSTVEQIHSDEWAMSHKPEIKAGFIRLLNLALSDWLNSRYVKYYNPKKRNQIFYFSKTKDLQPKEVSWKRIKESKRTVFGPHYGKKDPERIIYYRHLAFEPSFMRFAGQWYLQITPTYHFTSDGKNPSRYRESYLKGIKRIEKHEAVRGNIEFWASFLTEESLFSRSSLITFAPLRSFDTDFGIIDTDWLSKADKEEVNDVAGPDANETKLNLE